MKERVFQTWVIKTAEAHGWRVWHCPAPMRPIGGNKFVPDPLGAGLPDLILLRADPPGLIFAELKALGGKLSDRQKEFLGLARGVVRASREHGIEIGVYDWKPGSEPLIEAILAARPSTRKESPCSTSS